MILVSTPGKVLKSFAILYVLVYSLKNDLILYQKRVTHYRVEIHVETQCNIGTLSEKVQFVDLDISYEIKKNVSVFNIIISTRAQRGVRYTFRSKSTFKELHPMRSLVCKICNFLLPA